MSARISRRRRGFTLLDIIKAIFLFFFYFIQIILNEVIKIIKYFELNAILIIPQYLAEMLRPIASASSAPSPPPPHIKFSSHHRLNLHKPFKLNHPINTILKKRFTPSNPTLTKLRCSSSGSQLDSHLDESSGSDWELGDEEIEDEECPWEGAILYKRNGAVSHLEYCTTLERLGLGKVSSGLSRTRASEMGLRLVKPVTDYPNGTPVLISADVTRRKQKLRLDGIVRTVIALNCNR